MYSRSSDIQPGIALISRGSLLRIPELATLPPAYSRSGDIWRFNLFQGGAKGNGGVEKRGVRDGRMSEKLQFSGLDVGKVAKLKFLLSMCEYQNALTCKFR